MQMMSHWRPRTIVWFCCWGLLAGCGLFESSTGGPRPPVQVSPVQVSPIAEPSPDVPPSPGGESDGTSGWSPQLAATLRQGIGTALNIATIEIEGYRQQTWPDGCLGLGQPDELCLAMLTEGWQVDVRDPKTGERWVYRTDLTGEVLRLDRADRSR